SPIRQPQVRDVRSPGDLRRRRLAHLRDRLPAEGLGRVRQYTCIETLQILPSEEAGRAYDSALSVRTILSSMMLMNSGWARCRQRAIDREETHMLPIRRLLAGALAIGLAALVAGGPATAQKSGGTLVQITQPEPPNLAPYISTSG